MPYAPEQAEDIFLAAIEQGSESARWEYVERACGEDSLLRQRVRALLSAHAQTGSLLDTPPPGLDVTAHSESRIEGVGSVVGPYKLLQEIGEGGFGVVYLAEQTEPVRRKVALKVIKPGMDTREVIARFEAERQALALMEHPNIARVLDAGATDSGRPYFVMELVNGVPLIEFCDRHRLGIRERLELFVAVCGAVQHAHQHGVIHRDLKPGNVMVTLHDGRPVPKVIDFGVAKAISGHLTEKTLYTAFGQMVGTPAYMSPEQAKMTGLGVDTRSDVYSLGVLLYELLTGKTPLDSVRLRKTTFAEMQRLIRETEPLRPSLQIAATGDAVGEVAAARGTDAKSLGRLLRGDLDWIVMRALEKDRNRRYESASSFAADIGRFLRNEPVEASRPSSAYRFRKFAQRHKLLLGTVTLIAVVMLMATAISVWQAVRAGRSRDRAVEAEAIAADSLKEVKRQRDLVQGALVSARRAKAAEEKARLQADGARVRAVRSEQRAVREKATAIAVEEFLRRDLLAQADPANEPDRDLKLRTVLDRASARIKDRFKGQPEVEAAIRRTIGLTYVSLGEYTKARPHLNRYLHLQQLILGNRHAKTLSATRYLAMLSFWQGRYDEGERTLRKMLESNRRELGEEHIETRQAMAALGMICQAQGKYDEAESLYRKVIDLNRRLAGSEHLLTLTSMGNLAYLLQVRGDYTQAEALTRQLVASYRRVAGTNHPYTLSVMHTLATLQERLGRPDLAEKLLTETIVRMKGVLGDKHPATLSTRSSLAGVYLEQGRLSDAERLLTITLKDVRRVLGDGHADMIAVAGQLAALFIRKGEYSRAEELLVDTIARSRRALGDEHPHTLLATADLARVYTLQQKFDAAEKLLPATYQAMQRVLGKSHPNTLATAERLAYLYSAQGKHTKALEVLLPVLAIRRERFKPFHPTIAATLERIAWTLLKERKFHDAEPYARECLEIRKTALPDSWKRYHAESLLGGSLAGQKRYQEAESLLIGGYNGMKQRRRTIPPGTASILVEAIERLIAFYESRHATGDDKDVLKWRAELKNANQHKAGQG